MSILQVLRLRDLFNGERGSRHQSTVYKMRGERCNDMLEVQVAASA